MKSKIIVVNGGKYRYNLNIKKVKNLSIKIKSTGEILVTSPVGFPEKRIEEFIYSKSNWLEKHFNKVKKNLEEKSCRDIRILGKDLKIHISISDKREVFYNGEVIKLFVKPKDDATKIKRMFDKWYHNLACQILLKSSAEVYEKISSVKSETAVIKIRAMKSRWGSCYFNKNMIILNKHLIQLPQEEINHVILHEYAHFLFHNHGKEFKKFLNDKEINSDFLENTVRHQLHDDVDINSIMLRELS